MAPANLALPKFFMEQWSNCLHDWVCSCHRLEHGYNMLASVKAKKKERKTKNSPCKICVHHIIKLQFCTGIVTHFRENKDADQHKRQDGH